MLDYSLILDDNQRETNSGVTSEYPYLMDIVDMMHYSSPWHWHEAIEFKYVLQGGLKIMTENAEYEIPKGCVSFTNSNVLEASERLDDTEDTVIAVHLFHPILLTGHFQSIYEKKYVRPVLDNRQIEILVISPETEYGNKICQAFLELNKLRDQKNVEFQVRNLLSEIWFQMLFEIDMQLQNRPSSSIPSQDRIRYMIQFIQVHYMEKITLEDIAKSAHISEREALRTFKKALDKTPFDYLTDYRLTKSRELLSHTDQSITEIALNVGFSDSSYFGKLFRKQFGCTPGTFRKSSK